jgi:diguanylate cyclase (GGDEF)-like protein
VRRLPRVLCLDADPARRATLIDAVRRAGAEAVVVPRAALARVARGAAVAVGAGEEGLLALQRLLLTRPGLPRLALVEPDTSAESLVSLVERAQPFRIVRERAPGPLFAAALADALVLSPIVPTERALPLAGRSGFDGAKLDFAALTRDRLTGVHNHHYLRLRLDEELERTARYGRPLALAFVDVDALSALNDEHGRATGDALLCQVAATLVAGARAVDHVGRWSGGTFALVLPETTAGAALGTADRLRADLAARRFAPRLGAGLVRAVATPLVRVTVSCGLAAATSAHGTGTLVDRTARALERAKVGGGNRSVVDG